MSAPARPLELHTDVLIIGGGMAGAWAALAARETGAEVVLVDKGYCGTSGVTATAGPGHWWVPPAEREAAVDKRWLATLGLADKRWMHRILAETWARLPTLAPWYGFGVDAQGQTRYHALRGPEYMRALRQRIEAAGVTVLDHSPALELLLRGDGSAAGARGWQRRAGREWHIRAAAVILATGGCAFRSRLLGSGNNTGDGYLMGAEAGVELSSMEFSNGYCVAQGGTTMTRSMIYGFATYYDAAGREVAPPSGPDPSVRTAALAEALLEGPVYCSLHKVPQDIRLILAEISPNVPLLFARAGIDAPYDSRFEVSLHAEGTGRGTGGLTLADDHCQTRVPGLYAIGDTATRDLVAGANTGGGAVNSAWALSSGIWAGHAAGRLSRRDGRRADEAGEGVGGAGLRPLAPARGSVDPARNVRTVRDEMLPYDKNHFRSARGLENSLAALDDAWREIRTGSGGGDSDGRSAIARREAAALVASARWCYRAALVRQESRGLHHRVDAPARRAEFDGRLVTGGLDSVWTRIEPVVCREEAPA